MISSSGPATNPILKLLLDRHGQIDGGVLSFSAACCSQRHNSPPDEGTVPYSSPQKIEKKSEDPITGGKEDGLIIRFEAFISSSTAYLECGMRCSTR